MFIYVSGDPCSGFSFVGPFETMEQAKAFQEWYGVTDSWIATRGLLKWKQDKPSVTNLTA